MLDPYSFCRPWRNAGELMPELLAPLLEAGALVDAPSTLPWFCPSMLAPLFKTLAGAVCWGLKLLPWRLIGLPPWRLSPPPPPCRACNADGAAMYLFSSLQ